MSQNIQQEPDCQSTAIEGEAGATAVEYALLVALIATVIVGIVFILGFQVDGLFNSVIDAF